jgi:hypothetical protein
MKYSILCIFSVLLFGCTVYKRDDSSSFKAEELLAFNFDNARLVSSFVNENAEVKSVSIIDKKRPMGFTFHASKNINGEVYYDNTITAEYHEGVWQVSTGGLGSLKVDQSANSLMAQIMNGDKVVLQFEIRLLDVKLP